MSQSHKHSPVVDASDPEVVERRRPGRIANVSPALIPLLRDGNTLSPDAEEFQEKELAPAHGIIIGALISALFWAVLIWIV